jgi:hypothetical protein
MRDACTRLTRAIFRHRRVVLLLWLLAFLAALPLARRAPQLLSAGAFKFNRGATPHVEFAAVWANHLTLYRRAALRPLAATLTRWAVPYLESQKL